MGISWPAISSNVLGQPTKSDENSRSMRIRLTIDAAGRPGAEVCDDKSGN